jgi:hypothetical protein
VEQASKSTSLELNELQAENAELKLELLKWRKKSALYRLRHASVEEDASLMKENQALVSSELQQSEQAVEALKHQVNALLEKERSYCSALAHLEVTTAQYLAASCLEGGHSNLYFS